MGDETSAWRIFKTHRDKTYSFTDCTSFALMEKNVIKNAFAYDRHFANTDSTSFPEEPNLQVCRQTCKPTDRIVQPFVTGIGKTGEGASSRKSTDNVTTD